MTASREYPSTPLTGALAAVMHHGRLLLAQRAKDPDKGLWGLPGGLVEPGETVEAAAMRELAEETGVQSQSPKIIDRFEVGASGARFHYQLSVVLLDWVAGEGAADSDALAVGWYSLEQIAQLPCSATLPRVAELAFKHHNAELAAIAAGNLAHYNASAEQFWAGTCDHDVSQNIDALLRHIDGPAPFAILDFGCGPGRDLMHFSRLGHRAVGLDGAEYFVAMARKNSGCEVLHQDFLALDLPPQRFDGIFANASMFHVPKAALPTVLGQLHSALKPRGVLFTSNPRGENQEGWNAGRYGSYHDLDAWWNFLNAAGFEELTHYYRPDGLPRHQQPWLASVWRRVG